MGCWSIDSFGNDDAADWLLELRSTNDLSLVRNLVATTLAANETLDGSSSARILAAGEVVAAALGRPSAAAQDEEQLTVWLERVKPDIDETLVFDTIRAISKVLAPDSPLQRLWEAAGRHEEWLEELTGLLMRLRPNNSFKPKPLRGSA